MHQVKLYNTLTREKEEFKPITPGKVLMYHCGPTVYWTQHIGNMRAMVLADFIVRTFKYLGYDIKLVRNYTDVGHLTDDGDEGEDKMSLKHIYFKCPNCNETLDTGLLAREQDWKNAIPLKSLSYTCSRCGQKISPQKNSFFVKKKESPKQIANKYIKIFERDIKLLNILQPDVKPRATECVQDMIKMVKVLLDKGYAYSTDLAIYFDVSKAKDYTRLSRQKLEEQIKDAGKAEVSDPQKKHAADFAIWFFRAGKHQHALQYWPSPFSSPLVKNGEGFPGWHMECSVMANKFLAKTIDIHMGGVEHIPVHHTNEIAQSESANGVEFAHYWLHNEHLLVNGGKMSKSEGTAYALQEIIDKGYSALALRYFFLQAHYRSKQNFTWQALEAAKKGLERLKQAVQQAADKNGKINQEYQQKFIDYISDDFNMPQALSVAFELLKSKIPPADKKATLLDFDKVFGLKLNQIEQMPEKIPEAVKKMAQERQTARQNKNWAKADELRDKIRQAGYEIEDQPNGFKLKNLN